MDFVSFGIRYSFLYLLVYVIELAKSGKSANQVQNNNRKSKKISNYMRNDAKAMKYLFGQKILCLFGTFKYE